MGRYYNDNGEMIPVPSNDKSLGAGMANTQKFLDSYGQYTDGCIYADTLQVEISGKIYDGWCIPSYNELKLLYSNRTLIDNSAIANGGEAFNTEASKNITIDGASRVLNGYASSTFWDVSNLLVINFSNEMNYQRNRIDNIFRIRPVRYYGNWE